MTEHPSGRTQRTYWQYVAPDWADDVGTRATDLAEDDEQLDINYQRFGRAMEFGTTVAFLGSGWSIAIGYPSWKYLFEAMEPFEEWQEKHAYIGPEREVECKEPKSLQASLDECGPFTDEHLVQRVATALGLLKAQGIATDPPSLFEVLESSIDALLRPRIQPAHAGPEGRGFLRNYLWELFNVSFHRARAKERLDKKHVNPYAMALEHLPWIRRFVTTNFDGEIGHALAQMRRDRWRGETKLFSQNQPGKIALLSIPTAGHLNHEMVFHSHGMAIAAAEGQNPFDPKRWDDLILTEGDYKRWYLDSHITASAFRHAFQVLLQSNPLFIAGYALSDPDLVRTFRQLSIMKSSRRRDLFILLDVEKYFKELSVESQASGEDRKRQVAVRLMADQAKFGVSAFPFAAKLAGETAGATDLVGAIRLLASRAREKQAEWHRQPKGRALTPHASYQRLVDSRQSSRDTDWVTKALDAALDTHRVVTVCGPFGAGKYLKVSDYCDSRRRLFTPIVFSAHGNEDVYFYIRRVLDTVMEVIFAEHGDGRHAIKQRFEDEHRRLSLIHRLSALLQRPERPGRRPLLIVINGFDRFYDRSSGEFDVEDDGADQPLLTEFVARNSVAQDFLDFVKVWQESEPPSTTTSTLTRPVSDRLVITTQHVRRPLSGNPGSVVYIGRGPALLQGPLFSAEQLGLAHDEDLLTQLTHAFVDQPGVIPLATAFVTREEQQLQRERAARLLEVIRTAPVERGTRLVNHVLTVLDRPGRSAFAPGHLKKVPDADLQVLDNMMANEHLFRNILIRLSCFNRPFRAMLVHECLNELAGHITEGLSTRSADSARNARNPEKGGPGGELPLRVTSQITSLIGGVLVDLKLLEVLREHDLVADQSSEVSAQIRGDGGREVATSQELFDDPDHQFSVHPLVRRYCREVVAHGEHINTRPFGLTSALSRGPFEDPGQHVEIVAGLYRYLEREARRSIKEVLRPVAEGTGEIPRAGDKEAAGELERGRRLARAAFEVIRSNLSANTVARWRKGTFAEYLKMCATCFDLAKNYAVSTGTTWATADRPRDCLAATEVPLLAEEIIWLLNEMALAYYYLGSLRDSLRVWTMAFEWQHAIAERDPEQGAMYGASLRCNLGTTSLIMGRLSEAAQHFVHARELAIMSNAQDLEWRMTGFLARVDNLRGDLKAALEGYDRAIEALGKQRNLRAQSYFMRYRGLLKARLGRDHAEEDVLLSLNVAASEKHPDVMADARYFMGRVFLAKGKAAEALGEFRAALAAAKRLGMGLLETNILVGMASADLALGDAHAALDTAFGGLRLANECMWGLRQVEALTVIGQAYQKLGHLDLGRSYLRNARELAGEHEFRLHEDQLSKLLAAYPEPEPPIDEWAGRQ